MDYLANIREANKKIFHLDKKYNIENNGIIFVYTPPKVGSTTLVSSLRLSLLKYYSIIHIHDEIMLKALTGIENVKIIDIINYNARIGKKVYVIDIYRTPIERKMSEYFHNISVYNLNDSEENIKNYGMDRIVNRFNELYPHLGLEDHYFEKFGIVPVEKFDFEKKYIHQCVNNVNFIKLRLTDVSLWGEILSNILKMEVVIIHDYKSDDRKIMEDIYKCFTKEYRLPSNYYVEMEKSENIRYYMTEKEQEEYKEKWLKRICEPVEGIKKDVYNKKVLSLVSVVELCNPYVDEGCKCVYCSKKRIRVLEEYKLSGKIERIRHEVKVDVKVDVKRAVKIDKNKNKNKKCERVRMGMQLL